jgi:hypothetical protein
MHKSWDSFLVLAAELTAGEGVPPKLLYDQHRWFELREVISRQAAAPL